MEVNQCVICGARLHTGMRSWHRLCPSCGYEASALEPCINISNAHERIDETERQIGLQTLRRRNFARILLQLAQLTDNIRPRLLEVGAAYGWFLEMAAGEYETLGIEPDCGVFKAAQSKNLKMRHGFFPEVLEPNETFDVIIFNDVFEHIPDIHGAISSCAKHLAPKGIVAITMPDQRGFFYRVSKLLAYFGISKFFDRMWQHDFPSPHVHYFSKETCQRLMCANGFEIVYCGSLPSVAVSGLFQRIHYAKTPNIMTIFLYIGIALITPFLRHLPPDIMFVCFRAKTHTC